MADTNTSGAVHLTSLSLDISELQKQVDTVGKEMDELAKKAVEDAKKIRDSFAGLGNVPAGTGTGTGSGSSSGIGGTTKPEKQISVSLQAIANLEKGYASLSKTIESAKLTPTDQLKSMVVEIDAAEKELEDYRLDMEAVGSISKEAAETFANLKLRLTELNTEFINISKTAIESGTGFKTGADSIKNLDATIDSFTRSAQMAQDFLMKLNKGSTSLDTNSIAFRKIKTEASALATDLSELNKRVQENGTVSRKDAEQLETLNKSLSSVKLQLKETENNALRTGQGLKEIAVAAKNISVDQIAQLNLQYKNFLVTLSGSKLSDSSLKQIPADAKSAAEEILTLNNQVQQTNTVTAEQAQKYQELSSRLKELKGQFADVKTEANEQARQFQDINKAISETIPKLQTFEKTATFKKSREEASALKASFQELAAQIKNGTISVEEAKTRLSTLGSQFDDFASHVNHGNTALQNFVDKISESAKWQVANMLLNSVRQAFGNLTDTIVNTENAVIELRRVLGSEAPANTVMADELYDIAYEFGQTFEAVQETAVKFAQTGKDWQETIDATRATMLALNTAELDTAAATEGLIAVMSQFEIDAKDLETVIDKINITADNFPVTSEKIVAALQRAGGTAHAFNMSIEETIATITALAEKTGRSGENIGTALNSLIIFTSKSDNLNLFAGLSKQMDEVVNKFRSGSASIIDVWTQLSKEVENLSEAQQEALFNSSAYEEFADTFEAEAAEYASTIQDIYGTAGAYRRNYLTVLLQDMSTVENVLDTMSEAIGYSVQENETAMEAYSKKVTQLSIAFQQLAVDFGNSGALDLAKWIVEMATSLVKLTGSLGGFNTLLGATSTIILRLKREKINKIFDSLISPVKTVNTALKAFTASMRSGATATESMSVAVSTLKLSFGDITAIVTLLFTAFNIGKGIFDSFSEKAKEAREEAISTGDDAIKSANSLYSAMKKMNEAKDSFSVEEYSEATKELLSLLGREETEIPFLVETYGNLENAIRNLTDARLEEIRAEQLAGLEASKEEWSKSKPKINAYEYTTDIAFDEFANKIQTAGKYTDDFFEKLQHLSDATGPEDAAKRIEEVSYYIKLLESSFSAEDLKKSGLYTYLKDTQKSLLDFMNKIVPKMNALELLGDDLSEFWINYAENENQANNALNETPEAAEATTKSLEELEKEIEETGKRFDTLSSRIDSFQNSYNTLKGVIDSYNKTGKLTADQLQTLMDMEPEYLEMLEFEGGQMSINEGKLQDLMVAGNDYLMQMAAIKIAKQTDILSTQLLQIATEDLTEAEIIAKLKTIDLQTEVEKAAYAFVSGTDNGDSLRKVIAKVGEDAGLAANGVSALTTSVMNFAGSVKSLTHVANLQATMSQLPDLKIRPGETGTEFNERRAATLEAQKKALEEAQQKANKDMQFWFGTSSKKSTSSSKKTALDTLDDKAKAAMDSLKEMLAVYEHSIFLIDKNDWGQEKAVAIYREMQAKVHEQADKFREMGFSEDSEYIRELQKLHWGYHDNIIALYEDMYDDIIGEHENMIDELSYQYSQLEKAQDFDGMTKNLQQQILEQKAIQEAALKQYEQLLKVGVDKNDDAVQECLQTIRDAADEIQAINDKIKENVLGAYDDFISAADKFDLWDSLDFTKVDYLQRKMNAINQLFKDGTITLEEYNNKLREMTEAMYDAQVAQFEKQQEETKKYYDNLIDQRKEDIERLKEQKTSTKEYYDDIISGYKEEIEQWNKKKEEVTDYYDELISALQQVQKDNDRINRQIDYYNSRQKIITNLEQAQARSGVEWREKEMEYQQQLIDLDQEWNRTRQEWSIEDQITQLQELKNAAVADIEATVDLINKSIESVQEQSDAAIKSIEDEIAGIEDVISDLEKQAEEAIARIEEQIKELSQQIAAAFSSASMNGMLNTAQSINQAFANAGNLLFGGNVMNASAYGLSGYGSTLSNSFANSAQTAASSALKALTTTFVNPALPLMGTIGTALGTALTNGIKVGVSNLVQGQTASLLNNTLSSAMKSNINSIMQSSTGVASNSISGIMAKHTAAANNATSSLKTSSGNAVIYVTNNVNSVDSAADKTNNIIQNLGI